MGLFGQNTKVGLFAACYCAKECKKALQRLKRQPYWTYINGIIEMGDQEEERQPKQKRFREYIKSLRKMLL